MHWETSDIKFLFIYISSTIKCFSFFFLFYLSFFFFFFSHISCNSSHVWKITNPFECVCVCVCGLLLSPTKKKNYLAIDHDLYRGTRIINGRVNIFAESKGNGHEFTKKNRQKKNSHSIGLYKLPNPSNLIYRQY